MPTSTQNNKKPKKPATKKSPDVIRDFVQITCNTYGAVRTGELHGRACRIVPVVLITSGVFRGNHGDLEYTENELSRWPQGWNNKPVLDGHPVKNTGAGSSEVIEEKGIGILLNSSYASPKLKSEAWLYEDRLSDDLKEKLDAGQPVAVSTGLFHDVEVTKNSSGEIISRKVTNIVPDHLAVLLNEAPACSIESGAGLLMNSKGATENGLSSGDTREQLSSLVRNRFGEQTWIEDFFNDPAVVIFERNGLIYKLPFSIENDIVTLSDELPEKVIRQRQYRTEAGTSIGTTTNSNEGAMTKVQLIAALKQHGTRLTDEQMNAMDEAVLANLLPAGAPPTTETPPSTETQNSAGAAAAAPAFSWEALMQSAPADVREMLNDSVSRTAAERSRFIETITQNSGVTAEDLKGLKTGVLEKMASSVVAKQAAPAGTTHNSSPDVFSRFLGATGTAPAVTGGTTDNGAGATGPKPLLAPTWN